VFDATNTTWTVTYKPIISGQFNLVLLIDGAIWRGAPQVIDISSDGISGGIIAAIVLGVLAGVALIVGAVFIVLRRKKKYQSI
jgi:hypothetical protein